MPAAFFRSFIQIGYMKNDKAINGKREKDDVQFDHLEMHHIPGNEKPDEEKSLLEKLNDLKNRPVHRPWETINSEMNSLEKSGDEGVC